jgi:hypothetical protein
MTSTEYTIEQGVIIPTRGEAWRQNAGRKAPTTDGSHLRYPLYKLHVGQSFFVPLEGSRFSSITGGTSLQQNITATITQYRKLMKNDRKFVTRSVLGPDAEPLGIRCWRVR